MTGSLPLEIKKAVLGFRLICLKTRSFETRPLCHSSSLPIQFTASNTSRRPTRGHALSFHVAVEPSKIRTADATALFAKLGGATGPYLSLVLGNAAR